MSTKQKSSKKPRTPKKSKGIHGGGGKTTLTLVQRVLIRNAHPRVFNLQDTREQKRQPFPAALRPKV